jgi:hypothetical protein
MLAGLSIKDLDGPRRFLAADEILSPTTSVEARVDELGPGIGFAQRHGLNQGTSQLVGFRL